MDDTCQRGYSDGSFLRRYHDLLMLAMLSDTTVTGAHMSSLLPVLLEAGRHLREVLLWMQWSAERMGVPLLIMQK